MKLALLTTETPHHAHFARVLGNAHQIDLIVAETYAPHPAFATHHPFEDQRDEYERGVFFDGGNVRLGDVAEVLEVDTANAPRVIDTLRSSGPDAIIVLGTGKLGQELIDLLPRRIVNLHGGDPECYRGLDTHLWAVYHGEFDQLVTTLHHLDATLDTGDVILRTNVPITPGMALHQLRAANTQACIDLTLGALDMLQRSDRFPGRPQRRLGRYYSFMPADLKDICVRRFSNHTRGME